MNGDSRIYKAIDESLTLTQNSISAARLGAETVVDLANDFVERVAFAQGGTAETRGDVQKELDQLVARINTTISQSTFNGSDLVNGTTSVTVVTGISRTAAGSINTTSVSFNQQDLGAIASALAASAAALTATDFSSSASLRAACPRATAARERSRT